jgi:FkbM family methyltransferase
MRAKYASCRREIVAEKEQKMADFFNPSNYVRNVFRLTKMPGNVQTSHWYDNMRITRFVRTSDARLRNYMFGSSLISHYGKFAYNCDGKVSEIEFNGRNAQFHALYEQHYKKGYEFETAVLITRLTNGSKVFYDVGANWGYFSLLVASLPNFHGRIFAFEPNPTAYSDLTSTVQQAGLEQRITALNHGLGCVEGELYLEEAEKFKTGLARLSTSGSGSKVPVHTLDSLKLQPADVIKIDAEGMESDILIGGERTLREHRPFVVFENFLSFDDPNQTWSSLSILKDQGYRVFNPALIFRYGNGTVLASYGDSIDSLLDFDPNPKTALIETTTTNRFLMRQQINLFACHESRFSELSTEEFVHIGGF